MKTLLMIFTLVLLATPLVRADDLLPATSDDAKNFDDQLASHTHDSKEKKPKKENFGQQVSAEAKRLKDEGGDKKKQFGKWVSDQRKKSDQSRPDAASSDRGSSGERRDGSKRSDDSDASPSNGNGKKRK